MHSDYGKVGEELQIGLAVWKVECQPLRSLKQNLLLVSAGDVTKTETFRPVTSLLASDVTQTTPTCIKAYRQT